MKSTIFLFLLLVFSGCSKSILTYHGKHYKIILAGNQYWMAENLATGSYCNGKKIPLITDYFKWTELNTNGCCYYNNDTAMLRKYGMIYNWYAVETGKLCPLGWRVASNDDWLNLEKTLGGQLRAGGKLKSVSGWKGQHVSGDDIGFNALPGGYRLNEDFIKGYASIWWTSTPVDDQWVWGRRIDYQSTELLNTLNNRQNGFSVRCVRIKNVK
jgi:uncharacterized protein (TIGR02145 family)